MPTLVVVGAQWGDEAKGKVVDLLCERAHLVVRFTGGHNAGHTVLAGGRLLKFHLLPAGMLWPDIQGVMTSGVMICPKTLANELDGFPDITPDRLVISKAAQIVFSYHALLDGAEEEARGAQKLGTTKRGIGPSYVDKVARCGMRMAEFINPERRETKLRWLLEAKNEHLARLGQTPLDTTAFLAEYAGYADRLRPFVGEAERIVTDAVAAGKNVVFEGAHGTLLDIDLGTYPYVTSSHCTAGGATNGTGIGPTAINNALGVVKAYTTRVGEGPFPTELCSDDAERLRQAGKEFGTTTGRPRRCGWLDLVGLRYAVEVNGLTSIAVTRLDVLSGYDKLPVCVAYRKRNAGFQPAQPRNAGFQPASDVIDRFPNDIAELAECEPIYETVPGWTEDISGCRTEADLPDAVRFYLKFISDHLGIPVSLASVGAEREATILIRPDLLGR